MSISLVMFWNVGDGRDVSLSGTSMLTFGGANQCHVRCVQDLRDVQGGGYDRLLRGDPESGRVSRSFCFQLTVLSGTS